MTLTLVFLAAVLVCFGILIYTSPERYKLLHELEQSELAEEIMGKINGGIAKVKRKLTGGAKYGYGSDYDRVKQKRAIGSIRDTGEDR